ncbi:uncharacterized protein ACIB01_013099 [Guaruba guarouba]
MAELEVPVLSGIRTDPSPAHGPCIPRPGPPAQAAPALPCSLSLPHHLPRAQTFPVTSTSPSAAPSPSAALNGCRRIPRQRLSHSSSAPLLHPAPPRAPGRALVGSMALGLAGGRQRSRAGCLGLSVVAPRSLHSTQQPQPVYKRKQLFPLLPPALCSAVAASQGPFQVSLFRAAPPSGSPRLIHPQQTHCGSHSKQHHKAQRGGGSVNSKGSSTTRGPCEMRSGLKGGSEGESPPPSEISASHGAIRSLLAAVVLQRAPYSSQAQGQLGSHLHLLQGQQINAPLLHEELQRSQVWVQLEPRCCCLFLLQ